MGINSVAPVCPISRSQAVPGQPGILVPQVPRPTDLPSALQAINQILMILNPPTNYNFFLHQPVPVPRFIETNRVLETVRIYNPQDREQWVDVERINSLTFVDRATNGAWNWQY